MAEVQKKLGQCLGGKRVSEIGHYSSFIVKIWVERNRMIRGQIQHTATQEKVYFLELPKMTRFIMKHLDSADRDLAGEDEKSTVPVIIQDAESKNTKNPEYLDS